MKPKIVVIGSANTDMVVQVDHLPQAGETVLGDHFMTAQGGKGANQAVAAARLGAEVTFVARLGMDSFGAQSVAAYQAEGINTDFIIRDGEAPSGAALIMVNQSAENIIAVASGANARLSPEDILAAEDVIAAAQYVLLQLEIPIHTVEAAVKLAKQHGVRVILNPAPAVQLPPALLKSVDVLTPNENEAAILAGETSAADAKDAASYLAMISGVQTLVVTLGARGAYIIHHGKRIDVPPHPVKAIDTTAAGDAFNGALAVALARGEVLADSVRFANAAGALTTTKRGAQPSLPLLAEVEAFLTHA
jgi:ribokinase